MATKKRYFSQIIKVSLFETHSRNSEADLDTEEGSIHYAVA